MTHILIKDTETDRVEGRLCIERGVAANIIANTEGAAAALCKIAQAMDVDHIFLIRFMDQPVPPTEDGWRLTDAAVYVRHSPAKASGS